jgi:G:T-mismatch repair DNA endonuclease (very short patch repair protein)
LAPARLFLTDINACCWHIHSCSSGTRPNYRPESWILRNQLGDLSLADVQEVKIAVNLETPNPEPLNP